MTEKEYNDMVSHDEATKLPETNFSKQTVIFEKTKPVLVQDTFNFHTYSVVKDKFKLSQLLGVAGTVATAGIITAIAPMNFITAINTASYLGAGFMAIKGALSMLKHNDSPELVPMSKVVAYTTASAILLSIPTALTIPTQ